MCIRDSDDVVLDQARHHIADADCPRRWIGRVARRLGRDGAVSYTHLRAHETVLDIVCRLLLEKKKKGELS